MMKTEVNGRTIAVIFTCARCRKKETVPFGQCMKNESYNYLLHSTLPDGWREHAGSSVLCPVCATEYRNFMSAYFGGAENVDD